jgi:hypothetical protein
VKPTGYLGQGTHYSVFRAMVFHDPLGRPLPEGQFVHFAVIWDEDHDVRVMQPITEIYRRGLLSSFLMFGERRGFFTAIQSKVLPAEKQFYLVQKVDDLYISVGTSASLKNNDIVYVGDLVQKTEAEMLMWMNFGRRKLHEVKEVLVQMGLHLGMKMPDWQAHSNKIMRRQYLENQVNAICQPLDDPWGSAVVALDSEDNMIIHDQREKVRLYLKNLEMLWQLGIVAGEQLTNSTPTHTQVAA